MDSDDTLVILNRRFIQLQEAIGWEEGNTPGAITYGVIEHISAQEQQIAELKAERDKAHEDNENLRKFLDNTFELIRERQEASHNPDPNICEHGVYRTGWYVCAKCDLLSSVETDTHSGPYSGAKADPADTTHQVCVTHGLGGCRQCSQTFDAKWIEAEI